MNKPFAATSPSEYVAAGPVPLLQRTHGAARVSFKAGAGGARLDRLHQSGAAKVRFPHGPADAPPQAVLINTAGGLTGGDRLDVAIELGAGTHAAVTTQACERIYRSVSGDAEVSATIAVGDNARLDWLPQETILFDGGRLRRRIRAKLASGAALLALEAAIFGRTARGETVTTGLFRDRWRIYLQGRLVFADDLHLDWATAGLLARPAVLCGRAMATILFVAEEPDRHLAALRRILGDCGGVSAWDGKLLARIVASDGAALRRVLVPALVELRDGIPLPALWTI
jgi:urease accessory protein